MHLVVEGRAGEEAAVSALDDVIGAADHPHHPERERGTLRREVRLRPDLFGGQGGDVELVTDVHSHQRGSRLVHDHLLGAIGAGRAPSEDLEPLDLHPHPIVTGDPNAEVGLHALDQREHERERTRLLNHRQMRDVVDDPGIGGPHVDRHVGTARHLDEAFEAGGRAASSRRRGEDDRAREAGHQRQRDEHAPSTTPVGAHPESDGPIHRFIRCSTHPGHKPAAIPAAGVVAPLVARIGQISIVVPSAAAATGTDASRNPSTMASSSASVRLGSWWKSSTDRDPARRARWTG